MRFPGLRSSLTGSLLLGSLVLGAIFPAAAPVAGQQRLEATDTVDWHVVGAGETLEIITAKYLGTKDLWYENWRLNPQIEDPNLLRIGQRIRVITERQVPARRASLEQVANDVDKNPQRHGWVDAAQGDEVEAPAGIRTNARSSAEVTLDGGLGLTLTEYTQIFLKEMTTTLSGVSRGSIEIERGQADLDLRADRPADTDLEIVMGDSVARPRVGVGGRAETRARIPDDGGSQLMVYGGSSQIAAGGATVAVAAGMGTSVPVGGVPAAPERLLPRPVARTPANGADVTFRNPRFGWQAVPGAVRYVVEICRDAGCGTLVSRDTEVVDTRWQPDALPAGELYWRVTAVASSGLDGYPSRSFRLRVSLPDQADPIGDWVDRGPPAVVAMVSGPGSAGSDGIMVIGPGGRIELAARDDASGVAAIRYRWADQRWQLWRGRSLEPPAGAGPHRFEAVAEDQLGQTSEPWVALVVRDADAPAAPSVDRQDRP